MAQAGVLRCPRLAAILGLAALCMAGFVEVASAQNLFEALFGGLRRAVTPQRPPSYPDQNARYADGYNGGPSSGYCVRLCDGRYFPVSGRGRMNAAEMCRAFCPAAPTQIFSGGGIAHAVAPTGQRYSSLPNAFVYREKVVPDCSCNGKSPMGLVRFDGSDDPTLRTGDIVATDDGLMTYRNDGRHAEFTPIETTPGLPVKLKERLTQTRVAPGPSEMPDTVTDSPTPAILNLDQRAQASR